MTASHSLYKKSSYSKVGTTSSTGLCTKTSRGVIEDRPKNCVDPVRTSAIELWNSQKSINRALRDHLGHLLIFILHFHVFKTNVYHIP